MTRKANDDNSGKESAGSGAAPAWEQPKILLRETLTEAWERAQKERGTAAEAEGAAEEAQQGPKPGEAGSDYALLTAHTAEIADALEVAEWGLLRGYATLLSGPLPEGGYVVRVAYPKADAEEPGAADATDERGAEGGAEAA